MFYLIYVSSAAKLMSAEELLVILRCARDNNKKSNITGILLYQDGTFMQMLEGKEQAVMEMYKKIRNDSRHKGLIRTLTGNIKERNFEDWSMGFCNMDEAEGCGNYQDYLYNNLLLRSFKSDAQEAYKFMLMFNKIN